MSKLIRLVLLASLAGCAPKAEAPVAKSTSTTVATTTVRESQAPSLLSRELLFGNPDRSGAQISPDGTQLSWLAPKDGVMNVWVAPVESPDKARAVTDEKVRGIRSYFWAYTNRHILYAQDKGGDENWRIYAVDLAKNATKDLTPFDGVAARVQHVSPRFANEILVALNKRDPKAHDVHRVNVETGAMTLVVENKEGFAGYMTDDAYEARLAIRMTKDGGEDHMRPGKKKGTWETFYKLTMEDQMGSGPIGFDKTGKTLYMTDSRGRDTSAITAVDIATLKTKVLAEHPKADAGTLYLHPTEKTPQAALFNYLKNEWKVLDPAIQPDVDALTKEIEGELTIVSRSHDDQRWVIGSWTDVKPARYYLWDRKAKKSSFLFTSRKALDGLKLAKMHPVVIPARDGLELVSYLTLPKEADPDGDGKANVRVPAVLDVHGGPWGRDGWGLDPGAQWMADRGYAVLSVNFRGSTGFGKKFVNAGNKEWAGKMHDDLIDAKKWLVANGVTPEDKVCIMGGSYGGYATLVGLTFTPDAFACGVDIVGPSNLVTLLETIPPYWAPMMEMFAARVGDPRTPEGKKLLTERSPLSRANAIKKPLLIGQGANDPRVKQSESDQIVNAMKAKKIPVTYVLFPDEGHGFNRPENRMAFYAVSEQFLARQLGGRAEPIGDDFKGSSIQVPEGAEHVPGLAEAVKQAPKPGTSGGGN